MNWETDNFCRKEACQSGVYAKRHADLIPMPAYAERRMHVRRTPHMRTPHDVRRHQSGKQRRNVQREGMLSTWRAIRPGHAGTTSYPRLILYTHSLIAAVCAKGRMGHKKPDVLQAGAVQGVRLDIIYPKGRFRIGW